MLFECINANASVDDDIDIEAAEDCDRVSNYVQNCVICGFIYAFLVALSFCCSMVFLKL